MNGNGRLDPAPREEPHETRSSALGSSRGIRSLDDILRAVGPPLTTGEMARTIGMSATFVRGEIRSGHLRAVAIGRGRKRVFRISVREARRYIKALGLL